MEPSKDLLSNETLAKLVEEISQSLKDDSDRVSSMLTPLSGFGYRVHQHLLTLSAALEMHDLTKLQHHQGPIASLLRLEATMAEVKRTYNMARATNEDPWKEGNLETTIEEMAPYVNLHANATSDSHTDRQWFTPVAMSLPHVRSGSYLTLGLFGHYVMDFDRLPETFKRTLIFASGQRMDETLTRVSMREDRHYSGRDCHAKYELELLLPKLAPGVGVEAAQCDPQSTRPQDACISGPVFSYTRVKLEVLIGYVEYNRLDSATGEEIKLRYVTGISAYIKDILVKNALENLNYRGTHQNIDLLQLKEHFGAMMYGFFGTSDALKSRAEGLMSLMGCHSVFDLNNADRTTALGQRYDALVNLGEVTDVMSSRNRWFTAATHVAHAAYYRESLVERTRYVRDESGDTMGATEKYIATRMEMFFGLYSGSRYHAVIENGELRLNPDSRDEEQLDELGASFILDLMIELRKAFLAIRDGQEPLDFDNMRCFTSSSSFR